MDNVLYCVSFRDASENGEAVPELLTALGYDFSSRRDAETLELIHTLYFKTGDDARNALQQLQSMEETFRDLDIVIEKPILSELRKEDWAESWKIHFKPIEISETLAVTPSWSDFHARPGQHVIVLDPGMSFGTGQHATTKFCLSRLDRFAAGHDVSRASMLAAGCGSGILAIAAEKLGWGEIQAFDIDPDAVRIAGENAAANGCSRIRFSTASLIEFNARGRTFDVIAANILSSALLAGKDKLLSLLKVGGVLILAGILDKEYETVRSAFESAGCRQVDTAEEKQWRGGAFVREK